MTQSNTEGVVQAAAEQAVSLGAARAIGVIWREPYRYDLQWAAFAGPGADRPTLALLAERVLEGKASAAASSESGQAYGRFLQHDGQQGALVALAVAPLPWQSGLLNTLAEMAVLSAVLATERQRGQRLERWLAATSRSVAAGNIVTGLAHRINNPLTTIIGEAQLLQTEPLGLGTLASLSAIERAGQRIRSTVQSLVQFTHAESAVESIDVNATVETALSLVASQLEGAGVRLTARLAPNLPPVHADAAILTEAWVHLLVNAWQAIPSGKSGEVRIATRQRHQYVLTTVADNGPVSVRRRRLVQPFAPNTGGELFLAWQSLTRAGGQVIVASRPGIGTTIGVRLPLTVALK